MFALSKYENWPVRTLTAPTLTLLSHIPGVVNAVEIYQAF